MISPHLLLLPLIIAIIVIIICLYFAIIKKKYFILILLLLVIFFWPKVYTLLPPHLRDIGEQQQCLGIENYKTTDELQKRTEGKICYGWINPPGEKFLYKLYGFATHQGQGYDCPSC